MKRGPQLDFLPDKHRRRERGVLEMAEGDGSPEVIADNVMASLARGTTIPGKV